MVGLTTTGALTHMFLCWMREYTSRDIASLRDFIGTGWYSSEYIVGTKSMGNLELTAGLGFGRLSERILFRIPWGFIVKI